MPSIFALALNGMNRLQCCLILQVLWMLTSYEFPSFAYLSVATDTKFVEILLLLHLLFLPPVDQSCTTTPSAVRVSPPVVVGWVLGILGKDRENDNMWEEEDPSLGLSAC
jgi:hypothetical protein